MSKLLGRFQGGPAGSALQQAAQVVYDKLKGLWPRKMEAVVAAELWAHCRQPSSPHQLHFDTDETRLGASGVQADSLIHPVSPHGIMVISKTMSAGFKQNRMSSLNPISSLQCCR